MLFPPNKPNATNTQSERLTPCIECGIPTPYKTTNRVCCAACTKARRRQSYRKAADVQRRKKGIDCLAIGTEGSCKRCSTSFVRVKVRELYCDACKPRLTMDRRVERWAVNPAHALNSRVATAIYTSLAGAKGGRTWESLVGYTLADLIRHLERGFQRGMTLANHGEWHIDHIVPLSSFDFQTAEDAGFRVAWSLTNLRPLWASDNHRKKDKRLFLL